MAQIDGIDGNAAPVASRVIAGVDGNGDLQTILTSITGAVHTTPASGSSTDVNVIEYVGTAATVGAGGVGSGTQRTTLASDDPAVASLAIIDDWDESDRAKVNPIAGQAGVAAGAGAVDVLTQRSTLASDDPAVASLGIIDDWDESDRAKVNPIVGQAGVAAGAGAVGVTVPRTTLASDDPAVASLAIIDDWDESDRAKVNLIVGQAGIAAGAGAVGVAVPRTTLASDDPAVAALQIMDDWDATQASAVSADGPQVMIEGKDFDGAALPNTVTEGDAVRPAGSLSGIAYTMLTTEDGSKTPVNQTTGNIDNTEQDPLDEHYVETELVDTTNVGAATTYYPDSSGQAMGNKKNVSIHGVISGGVTFTFEAKIDDSTDWVDITKAGYRLDDNSIGNASIIDDSFIIDWDGLRVRTIRIASVTADATNGVQYHWKLTAL